jgi:hypothetical protein
VKLTLCSAEDRKGAEIGLKLLVLSAAEHCPDVPFLLYRPNPLPEFAKWVKRFPQVRLIGEPLTGAHQWNCKPQALLPLLTDDVSEAVWLDSDLMLTRDPRPLFRVLPPATLGITQEPPSQPDQGSVLRTRGWSLPVGRELTQTLNSCVLRVTRQHLLLLNRWREFLERPDYIAVQAKPVTERPVPMASDQDVLNALLGSVEFASIPLGVWGNGRDVIHSGGALAYSVGERLTGLFRTRPTFFHAISVKPWMILNPRQVLPGRAWWFRRLMQEVSPYVAYAKRYRGQVEGSHGWIDWSTPLGTGLRVAGLGHWALRGLPVTVAATALKRLNLLPRA